MELQHSKNDRQVKCVSDFCGSYESPGAWADLYERKDGTRYIRLGGGWLYYGKNTTEFIEDSDPHFVPFLKACDECEDFTYARTHWDS